MRAVVCAVLLAGLAAVTAVPAQSTFMDVVLNPEADSSPFIMHEVLSMAIDYPQNGSLSEFLNGRSWYLTVEAGPEDAGVQQLMDGLNSKIRSDGSQSSVSGLTVEYLFSLNGSDHATYIDFQAVLTGNITGYATPADQGRTLVDLGWRGLGLNKSVSIGGFDITFPLEVLRDREPVIYDLVQGEVFGDAHPQSRGGPHGSAPDAEANVSLRLVDSDTVLGYPMKNWVYDLFTEPLTKWESQGLLHSLDTEMVGHPATVWHMGHSLYSVPDLAPWLTVVNGTHPAIPGNISYNLWIEQYFDMVTIAVVGIAELDVLDGIEVAVVEAKEPEILPMAAIYVVVGLAAAGGGLFVAFRRRSQKNEKRREVPS